MSSVATEIVQPRVAIKIPCHDKTGARAVKVSDDGVRDYALEALRQRSQRECSCACDRLNTVHCVLHCLSYYS